MDEKVTVEKNEKFNFSAFLPRLTPYLACAAAALSLIFAFLVGYTATSGGVSQTTYLYYYFGGAYGQAALAGNSAAVSAVTTATVFGTIISALGLLSVIAFASLTIYRAIRLFVLKQEYGVEKFAVCAYISYIAFASLYFALFNRADSSAGLKIGYNAATIVGLVLTSVVAAAWFACKIYSNLKFFRNRVNLANFIYSSVRIAVIAVTVGLLATYVAEIGVGGGTLTSGFFGLVFSGAAISANDNKLTLLTSSAAFGYAVAAALIVLYLMLVAETLFNMFGKRQNDGVFFAVGLGVALFYLFFAVMAGNFYPDLVEDSGFTVNVGMPIAVFCMTVLLFIIVQLQGAIVGAFTKKYAEKSVAEGDEDVLLEVKNLSKYFVVGKDFFGRPNAYLKAVDGISFKLKKGKTLGIVGESGCGKSTMGRTLLRLYDGAKGDVWFKGEKISDLSNREFNKLRPNIQMIFQDPYASLSPRLTVGEIIGESARQHKIVSRAEYHDYVLGVMKMCGLQPHYFERYPHEFSGGQRQRICIARALALKPELVVCDEPVSALDVSIQAQIINMLIELRKTLGLTYIFISHDLSVVKHISDDVGVMYLGNIVEYGSKEDIFNHTLHPYTKALFSAVPVPNPHVKMNRIVLKGDIPSPVNPPKGCKFHTRCESCMGICEKIAPIYKEVEKDHFCACHLYNTEEETAMLIAKYEEELREAEEEKELNKVNIRKGRKDKKRSGAVAEVNAEANDAAQG